MISVCMCTYNGERFVEQQMECIRKQTSQPDEVIICDDSSVDSTVEIVKNYIKRYHLESTWKLIVNKEQKGYPANFYYAMNMCRGDVVFPADQDDIWEYDKIRKMCRVLEQMPEIKVLSCCLGIINENGDELKGILAPKKVNTGLVHPISVKDVLYMDCWAGMSLVYRREFWESIREQVQSGSLPHDRALWTLAADRNAFFQMDDTCVYHRRHNKNACNEEHRVRKLMKYERKIAEIQTYIGYLQGFLDEKVELTQRSRELIYAKKERLNKRCENLENRNIPDIIREYIQYPKEIRGVTMLCDLGITILRR